MQARKIEVAPIKHVEGAGLDGDVVENLHVGQFSVGSANKSGNVAV